jgi:hypothetical protein
MNIPRMLLKAALLFVILNGLFALTDPLDFIGHLTLHNRLLPGRVRLPYGEDPRAYNLSLNNLPAMFSTHEIEQGKAEGEFRVMFIGDSSTWGILLRPDETVTGSINQLNAGNRIQADNLGHPILSLTKDLLLLDYALQYEPDLVVWLTTLRSFPVEQQFSAPLVQNNAERIRRIFQQHGLADWLRDALLIEPSFLDRTIVGQRRPLADWLRLQLYGGMWSITGIDQVYRPDYTPRTSDFEADMSWRDYTEPVPLTEDLLAFDILRAGHARVGDIPLLLVNEPIFISTGINSNLRYNLWYPRWAYDAYRALYADIAARENWRYLDLWDLIASEQFTDSPVHLTPTGSRQLAERLNTKIQQIIQAQE